MTTKEIFDILNNLNVKKPLGPSLIPAWALKDAREHIADLLQLIAKLILFFRKNELIVNESKTEFTVFGAPKRNKIEEIIVNGCRILEKKVVKYLGVHIDCNLSFDEEIKKCTKKNGCWHQGQLLHQKYISWKN